MTLGGEHPAALAAHYRVHADDGATDLGSWSKVTGLDPSSVRAGERGRWLHPGLRHWPTIVLERAATAEATTHVCDWLNAGAEHFWPAAAALVELFDGGNNLVRTWNLSRVVPVAWHVSAVEAGSSQGSLETLELTSMDVLRPRGPTA